MLAHTMELEIGQVVHNDIRWKLQFILSTSVHAQ